jgi:hypothetical protein
MIEHGLTTRQRAGFETLAQAPCRAASGFGQHSRGLIVAAHAPFSGMSTQNTNVSGFPNLKMSALGAGAEPPA